MPTTDQLQAEIDELKSRLSALDGIGLSDPTLGTVPTLQRDVAGLRSTIKQVGLKMEQVYKDLRDLVTNYIALVKQKFGA